MKKVWYYDSPIGLLGIGCDEAGVSDIFLEKEGGLSDAALEETPMHIRAAVELVEYFMGDRRGFSMPLSLKGTEFQKKVWRELLNIPYGQTRSYQDIAAAVGSPKAARAVGMANHNNPVMIVVPCHRVVGKRGNLTGYAGGLDVKAFLLELEAHRPMQFPVKQEKK